MALPAEQRAVGALLGRLAGAAPVETEISALFVGPEEVWKLRKAVRLGCLDFTPLEARRLAAGREVALNAAAAPGLYRGVVAVTRGDGGALALGGTGEAVDWVVRMARVPAGDFLEARLPHGLDAAILEGLADAVAAWHRAAPVARRDQAAAFARVVEGNAAAARAAGLAADRVAGWRAGMLAALGARAGWLAERAERGFVRRGHGDLHLGNACLWQGRPVPFDALEFDEDLATLDLGYDLASLLMDLDVRAGRAAANRVLNRYVALTGDWDLVRGLPPFLSLRAMARAPLAARAGRQDEAARYLRAAEAALRPAPPVVVAVGGLPGSGKSTLARALAPELGPAPGALVVRSDEIRKRRHGVAPEVRLPESAYRSREGRAVFAELARAVAEATAAGQAVVADATFLAPADREAVARAAGATHFVGVWLQAPLAVLEARVAGRGRDASDATVAVLRHAAAADRGAGPWQAVDSTDGAAALAAVRLLLAGNSC